jgi:hypothetical protein
MIYDIKELGDMVAEAQTRAVATVQFRVSAAFSLGQPAASGD